MKTTPLLATLSLLAATPFAMATDELDTLRARCAAQEEQIRQLEAEVQKLRGGNTPAPTPTPTLTPAPVSTPAPASQPVSQSTYTVRPGDSLQRIAQNLGCSPKKLAASNGLKLTSVIHPGQKLKVPNSAAKTPPSTSASAAPTPTTASGKSHKIQDGETLFSIARKYGVSVEALTAANPNLNPRTLRPGQIVILPSSSAETKPSPEAGTLPPATAAANNPPQTESSSPTPQAKIRSIIVENEITYGDFAAAHGTDTSRLNDLNGLDLTNATVLAKGSELYVPAQP